MWRIGKIPQNEEVKFIKALIGYVSYLLDLMVDQNLIVTKKFMVSLVS